MKSVVACKGNNRKVQSYKLYYILLNHQFMIKNTKNAYFNIDME